MERSPGGNSRPTSETLIPISIEPVALSDIEGAATWFESQRPGLGTEFILELDHSIERVGTNPEAFAQVYRVFRRALLRRFPYALYFTYESDLIRVTQFCISTAHQSSYHHV